MKKINIKVDNMVIISIVSTYYTAGTSPSPIMFMSSLSHGNMRTWALGSVLSPVLELGIKNISGN